MSDKIHKENRPAPPLQPEEGGVPSATNSR